MQQPEISIHPLIGRLLLNTLSLCISSTLFTLFFRNHSIGAIDDFLKNRQQKKQPMLLDCHAATFTRLYTLKNLLVLYK